MISEKYGKEFLSAAIKARKEMDPIIKSGRNNHQKYDYAKYEDLVHATFPALANNGLAIRENIFVGRDSREMLEIKLIHIETLQYDEATCILPVAPDDQSYGKSLTYRKKYLYSLLVGIPCPGDDDADDGKPDEIISDEQANYLANLLKGNSNRLKEVLEYFKINSLTEIKAKNYASLVERIKAAKEKPNN